MQEAQLKQQQMTEGISRQTQLLSRIVMLTYVVDELTVEQKQVIYVNLKDEVIHWMKALVGLIKIKKNDCIHGMPTVHARLFDCKLTTNLYSAEFLTIY